MKHSPSLRPPNFLHIAPVYVLLTFCQVPLPLTDAYTVYPLSEPQAKAMEEYISEALKKGFIQPGTSPASTGFFFMGKKRGFLHPCID